MTTRKKPVRHVVHSYTKDDGTKVRSHAKGSGTEKVTYREGSIIPDYLEQRMKEKSAEYQISELEKIYRKAKISKDLKNAVAEAIKALKAGNIQLAADITSVKSYVSGYPQVKGNHFVEDTEYNQKIFGGESVYGILDSIHHNLSFASGTIPSGAVILTATGTSQRKPSEYKSPTLKLIKREHDAIWKKAHKKK